MTKEEQREIRSVLLGRTLMLDDGSVTSWAPGEYMMSNGVADGAGAVRIFGMSRKARCYRTDQGERRTMEAVAGSMREFGRALILREQPESAACLIRYVLTRPVVLVFRYVEGVPVLTAWTGRSPTAFLAVRRAFRAFERSLPECLSPSPEKAPAGATRNVTAAKQSRRTGKEKKEKKRPARLAQRGGRRAK